MPIVLTNSVVAAKLAEYQTKLDSARSKLGSTLDNEALLLAVRIHINTGSEYDDFLYPSKEGESSATATARSLWTTGYCGGPECSTQHSRGETLLG